MKPISIRIVPVIGIPVELYAIGLYGMMLPWICIGELVVLKRLTKDRTVKKKKYCSYYELGMIFHF